MKTTKYRGIYIDPAKKTIMEVYSDMNLQYMYDLIGEDALDWCRPLGRGHVLYVGDHSRLHEPPLASFRIWGYHEVLYGPALVLGVDAAGETVDATISIDDLWEFIGFEVTL